jgi:hypothetical protein
LSLLDRGRGLVLLFFNMGGLSKKATPIAPHRLKARPLRR